MLGLGGSAAVALLLFGRSGSASPGLHFAVDHTPDQWRRILGAQCYAILREGATERAFTSPLLNEHRKGVFACAGCGLPLFRSAWKFESGTGWPSFYQAISGAVATKTDRKLLMARTEYHCAQCLGHQGHLFDDGPQPTGLRYCNNGAALKFVRG